MDSKGVNITWNRIWECDVGIQLLSSGSTSSSVVVHHNDFISNGIQALDNGGTQNTWDDGVGEGNYWSGFGVDNNHDGIADFPYEIDEDSEDRYPLMESVY